LLNKSRETWGEVLGTFNIQLCQTGIVEKGLVGELAAWTLLLVTRDFAVPTVENDTCPDMLQPIPLLLFLNTLFGDQEWCHPHQLEFETSFQNAHLNFTHWIITRDPLPQDRDM
jgi:hypothetical protein